MMHPSTSVLMLEQGTQNGCHQCLSLREVQVASCLSQKLSKISSWVCPRLLSKHVRFLCAPFKSRISVICSPPVLLYASPIGLPQSASILVSLQGERPCQTTPRSCPFQSPTLIITSIVLLAQPLGMFWSLYTIKNTQQPAVSRVAGLFWCPTGASGSGQLYFLP